MRRQQRALARLQPQLPRRTRIHARTRLVGAKVLSAEEFEVGEMTVFGEVVEQRLVPIREGACLEFLG